jgi:hypothetical protein
MTQINLTTARSKFIILLPYILAIALLISVSMLFSKCQNEQVQLASIHALQFENLTYKLRNGQLVTSQEVASLNQSQMKLEIAKSKTALELSKKFHEVKTLTKLVQTIKIDTVQIAYKDSVPYNFEKKGVLIKNDYKLEYKSNQSGVTISNIEIPDSLIVITGIKRKWFLGKETQTIDITHSNKLIKDSGLQHFELVKPKKFWQTTVFKIGIGVIGGILIAK